MVQDFADSDLDNPIWTRSKVEFRSILCTTTKNIVCLRKCALGVPRLLGDIGSCLVGQGPNKTEIVVLLDYDPFKKVRTQLSLLSSWPTITLHPLEKLLPVSMPTNWPC